MSEHDDQRFRHYLEELGAGVPARRSFFDPRSVFWRVAREPALLVAGMRALLMQVAHPKVAQGVADHSRYREDPLGRGIRTFSAVYAMVFGSRDQAIGAALKVHGIHCRVQGRVREPLPPGVDPAYSANDPQLLFWVAATLLDSSVVAYEAFVEPLSGAQKEELYQDSKLFGQLFGVPRELYPQTWRDFAHWMDEAYSAERLTVTATARDICDSLLRGTWFTRVLAPANYVAAAMLLPDALADAYGFRRGVPVRLSYRVLVAVVRGLTRVVPRRLRGVPAARRMERRLAKE
ncbi:MAG TPA: oxygenase MpaB family protein [Gammaproteobacteria bacterium]|nr:oxygenase MpaB family protein [Gammaproteobacteria bacterium]